MSETMIQPVVHLSELPLTEQRHGTRFTASMAQLPAAAGARKLGARLTEVPPGKTAWPHHCHHVNEEMFVILAGRGTLRLGEAGHPIAAGDVVVCPAGGPETAHQIVNDGTDALRYLAISTMEQPDVCEYPDSGKFTVMVGAAPGGPKAQRRLGFCGRLSDAVDYWDGE